MAVETTRTLMTTIAIERRRVADDIDAIVAVINIDRRNSDRRTGEKCDGQNSDR